MGNSDQSANALLLVERILGTPASQQELNGAGVHLGSTCNGETFGHVCL